MWPQSLRRNFSNVLRERERADMQWFINKEFSRWLTSGPENDKPTGAFNNDYGQRVNNNLKTNTQKRLQQRKLSSWRMGRKIWKICSIEASGVWDVIWGKETKMGTKVKKKRPETMSMWLPPETADFARVCQMLGALHYRKWSSILFGCIACWFGTFLFKISAIPTDGQPVCKNCSRSLDTLDFQA